METEKLAKELVQEISAKMEKYAAEAPELIEEMQRRLGRRGEDIVATARDMLGLLAATALPPEPSDVLRGMQAFNDRQSEDGQALKTIEWFNEESRQSRSLQDSVGARTILTSDSRGQLAQWLKQLTPVAGVDDEPPSPSSDPSPRGM